MLRPCVPCKGLVTSGTDFPTGLVNCRNSEESSIPVRDLNNPFGQWGEGGTSEPGQPFASSVEKCTARGGFLPGPKPPAQLSTSYHFHLCGWLQTTLPVHWMSSTQIVLPWVCYVKAWVSPRLLGFCERRSHPAPSSACTYTP